ncbi:MAG: single-stranded-DNA-specific exonuclease RecJ [Acidobacteria bacterium]|nr:single-stranded-DNA-specific exonuclease RecJ [Acidobacteriota bacterium]
MTRRPARWNLPVADPAKAKWLAAQLHLAPLTARILVNRGYADAGSANQFLHPSIDSLHDPFLMKGMEQAARRLLQAVRRNEKVLLYGDYDVDGTTSIVLLSKVLQMAGNDANFHVPHRLKDGYGMRPEVINEAAQEGTTLIVSMDTGIRANEVVKYARELGVDVIVTDHHLPEAEIPPAYAVLNPNQPGCEYPEKNLCGAGVAFKLVQALLRLMEMPAGRVKRLTESFLKVVAIATVADVVPLTGENRVIVKHGLSGLGDTNNLGLKSLLTVAGFQPGEAPTAGQVAFRLAPRINATGRMDSARNVIELFLTSDHDRARELSMLLDEFNRERQEVERDILAATLKETEEWPVDDERRALVFAGEGWHHGVAGIVASRLVERFHRPVFVLEIDPVKQQAVGSGRSVPAFHLLEALESMPKLFVKFGGHHQAAGLTMDVARLEEFKHRFAAYARERLDVEELCPHFRIDAEVELRELTPSTGREVLSLGPFGYGNPTPVLAVRGATLRQPPSIMKERHLKFFLQQDRFPLTCKAWNWVERLDEFPTGDETLIDAVFALEEDTYSAFSATLRDLRLSTPSFL